MHHRGVRRHQAESHMNRRLKEDRNQHYNDLTCPCWTDRKAMSRFKEQPKLCSCDMCGNPRKSIFASKSARLTMQERRFLSVPVMDDSRPSEGR